jgi:UDP-N-acetylglucosamine 2-epimerase
MKVLTVTGARPQFIKMAPLSLALRTLGVREVSVHTGQHYDPGLSEVFFEQLGLPPPDHRLEVGSASHAEQTARILSRIGPVLEAERPDWVVIIGDTNSTLAAALAAAKLGLPLAHVEAGLRSHNRRMPEEANRLCADHLADRLYHATRAAEENLAREGLLSRARRLGDVTVDAVRLFLGVRTGDDPDAAALSGNRPFAVLTLHRAENTDDPVRLRLLWEAVNALDRPVVFPAHPRTLKAVRDLGLRSGPRLRIIEPVGYPAMLRLLQRASLLLTDSGGLQKEAVILATPCLTLRTETEWTETVHSGWNRLYDPDSGTFIDGAAESARRGREIKEYGDGRAAERIAHDLRGDHGA